MLERAPDGRARARARAARGRRGRGRRPALLPEAECAVGGALVACGRQREALEHLARAIELCTGDAPRRSTRASAATRRRSRSAHRASRSPAAAMTRARATPSPPPTSCCATIRTRGARRPLHCAAATAAHVRGDHDEALSAASAAIAVATAEDLRERLPEALALHGWARVRAGAHDDGLGELRARHRRVDGRGATAGGPFVHGLLADALATTGEPARALTALDAALRWVGGGERWYEPELHRMRAELLLTSAICRRAPQRRHRRSLARRMRAGAWERRAAATMARLGSAAPVA